MRLKRGPTPLNQKPLPQGRNSNSNSGDKILNLRQDAAAKEAERQGFHKPRTPEWNEKYDVPPTDPTSVSSQELAERYSYSQAMLSCASRMLGEKKAERVILKSKTSHFKKKALFMAGGSESKKWQAEGRIENDPEFEDMISELTLVDAFCEMQEGVVKHFEELSRVLSREQSRRGDEMQARMS